MKNADIKSYIKFYLDNAMSARPFMAKKMAITHCELNYYDIEGTGPLYKRGVRYFSGGLRPDLWIDGQLIDIKAYNKVEVSADNLAQLLAYYSIINHRFERNVEGEELIKEDTKCSLPKINKIGIFFARQHSTVLYNLKDIAEECTLDRFATLFYCYSRKYGYRIAKEELCKFLTAVLRRN